jgi:hypothetical protein
MKKICGGWVLYIPRFAQIFSWTNINEETPISAIHEL